MLSYADGCTMSSKKDGLVNIGGLLCFRDEALMREAMPFNIMYEGYNTYGGMAGRDLGALSVGLREATELDYLESRIAQVARLGSRLESYGVPVLRPYGGHAIFVDARSFLPRVQREEFAAQTLGIEAYIEGGVRGVEVGTILADRDPCTGRTATRVSNSCASPCRAAPTRTTTWTMQRPCSARSTSVEIV